MFIVFFVILEFFIFGLVFVLGWVVEFFNFWLALAMFDDSEFLLFCLLVFVVVWLVCEEWLVFEVFVFIGLFLFLLLFLDILVWFLFCGNKINCSKLVFIFFLKRLNFVNILKAEMLFDWIRWDFCFSNWKSEISLVIRGLISFWNLLFGRRLKSLRNRVFRCELVSFKGKKLLYVVDVFFIGIGVLWVGLK